jgi:hypothetical protein
MTTPLEKEIEIILTSIERGYHAIDLRLSAFICGSFLIYNFYLCLMKIELHLNITFTLLSKPFLTRITQRY